MASLPAAGGGRPRAVRAGRLAALLLTPTLGLGLYLLVVPDNVAFKTAQLVTLAHVALALLTVPLVAIFAVNHARRTVTPPSVSRFARATTWVLVGCAALALATGLGVLPAHARPLADLHALFGAALTIPLALHLLLTRRRATGIVVVGVSLVSLVSAIAVRGLVTADTAAPQVPAFDYTTRPASLYDDAEWCGGCHHDAYDEWRRSTHAHTFERRRFLASLPENPGTLGHDLAEVGAVMRGPARSRERDLGTAAACTACHAPLAFYADAGDPRAGSASSEGVGCSFCHTLRAVENGGRMGPDARAIRLGNHDVDPRRVIAELPYNVSAPESVRRYLFQHTGNRWTDWLGDALIRWRPSMHRWDYRSDVLSTDRSCRGCHPDAMDSAEIADLEARGLLKRDSSQHSAPPVPRAGGARGPCVACHMALTPRPRDGARPSHLFLGGNVEAALESRLGPVARLEHAFASKSVSVAVGPATVVGRTLSMEVTVRNEVATHAFPAFEAGGARRAWLRVSAFGAHGEVLVDSQQRDDDPPEGLRVTVDSVMAPHEERTFSVSVHLAGDAPPVKILAEVFKSLDGEPIAAAMRTLPTNL